MLQMSFVDERNDLPNHLYNLVNTATSEYGPRRPSIITQLQGPDKYQLQYCFFHFNNAHQLKNKFNQIDCPFTGVLQLLRT